MGPVPSLPVSHIWDWSHRFHRTTYGTSYIIIIFEILRSPIGLTNLNTGSVPCWYESHTWDWSHSSKKTWDQSHIYLRDKHGTGPIGLHKPCMGIHDWELLSIPKASCTQFGDFLYSLYSPSFLLASLSVSGFVHQRTGRDVRIRRRCWTKNGVGVRLAKIHYTLFFL